MDKVDRNVRKAEIAKDILLAVLGEQSFTNNETHDKKLIDRVNKTFNAIYKNIDKTIEE